MGLLLSHLFKKVEKKTNIYEEIAEPPSADLPNNEKIVEPPSAKSHDVSSNQFEMSNNEEIAEPPSANLQNEGDFESRSFQLTALGNACWSLLDKANFIQTNSNIFECDRESSLDGFLNAIKLKVDAGENILIGLTGYATVGKSFVANLLKEKYGFYVISFADPLRQVARLVDKKTEYCDEIYTTFLDTFNLTQPTICQKLQCERCEKHLDASAKIKDYIRFFKRNSPPVYRTDYVGKDRRLLIFMGKWLNDYGKLFGNSEPILTCAAQQISKCENVLTENSAVQKIPVKIVFDDVRFETEVKFLQRMGFDIFRIVGKLCADAETLNHPTENDLANFKFHVINNL